MTPADMGFHLVRPNIYRIGNSSDRHSEPAPLFTPIVAPSAAAKGLGEHKKELAGRHEVRLRFWKQLLERAKAGGVTVHANVSPSTDNWISAGAGKTGRASATWCGSKTGAAVGSLHGRRACRVRYTVEEGGIGEGEERWPAIQDTMVDAMGRQERSLKPRITTLDV